MDTLWPNVLPVYRLGICLMPCPLGTQRLPQDFPGGQPASGHALSLSFSSFPGPWPPSPVLCYKSIGGCLDHLTKEAAGSCCCSCCNFTLMSDAHWCGSCTTYLFFLHIGTGICPLKLPVPHKSLSPDW